MTNPGNTYSKSDAANSAGILAMEDHVQRMRQAGGVAEQINSNIAAGYYAGSSQVFQHKVQDWVDQYQAVMSSFQQLAETSRSVDNIINHGEDDAHSMGGSWPVSESVYNGLT